MEFAILLLGGHQEAGHRPGLLAEGLGVAGGLHVLVDHHQRQTGATQVDVAFPRPALGQADHEQRLAEVGVVLGQEGPGPLVPVAVLQQVVHRLHRGELVGLEAGPIVDLEDRVGGARVADQVVGPAVLVADGAVAVADLAVLVDGRHQVVRRPHRPLEQHLGGGLGELTGVEPVELEHARRRGARLVLLHPGHGLELLVGEGLGEGVHAAVSPLQLLADLVAPEALLAVVQPVLEHLAGQQPRDLPGLGAHEVPVGGHPPLLGLVALAAEGA